MSEAVSNPTGPVLVGYDGSAGAKRALDVAAALADSMRAPLRILFAQGPIPAELDATPALREAVDKLAHEASTRVQQNHPALAVSTQIEWGAARKALLEASRDARVTVVGHRGHGPLKSVLLGSVSGAVAAHAEGPVLVVPDRDPNDTGTVVVGVDGSEESLHAARYAIAFADGRPVTLLHAWQPLATTHPALGPYGAMVMTDPESDEAEHRALLDKLVERVSRENPEAQVSGSLVHDSPAIALGRASDEADLLVVSTRGHGGFSGLLLGSVAQSVVQTSACPVLVTRGKG